METSLLTELFYLPLQLPVGQPHLLELQLALVQLAKEIKEFVKEAGKKIISGDDTDWMNLLVCEGAEREEQVSQKTVSSQEKKYSWLVLLFIGA